MASATDTDQILPGVQPQIESIISINIPISIKLSETNFLTWKAQVLPIIMGHKLTKFIESDASCTAVKDSPEHFYWTCQDALLLGWIRSSLTETVQGQVVRSSTSAELWTNLTQIFAASSSARCTDLRRQLQTTSKASMSCRDFLHRMRQIADELAFVGTPISDDELVMAILNGLGPEYNPFVITITTTSRHTPYTFADIHSTLLAHESLLQGQSNTISLPSIQSPNAFAVRSNYRGPNPRNPYPIYQSQSYQNPITQFPGNPPSPRPFYQLPTGPRPPRPDSGFNGPNNQHWTSSPDPNYTKQKPKCQICMKIGHTAKLCYFRYNPDQANVTSPQLQAPDAAPQQPSTFHAYVNQPPDCTVTSNEWILDSGATHHVTSDINNISSFYAYEGNDHLQIGPPHQQTGSSS